MPKRLIVNIRGANAAGKTTLMRHFLGDPFNTHQLVAPDGTKVDIQTTDVFGLTLPVAIIGKYDASKYSGCDKIKSAEAIEWAIKECLRLFEDHHVMFEGFRVSKSYKRYAALRNELSAQGEIFLWVFLHAPKELIFERAQARRDDGKEIDKKELTSVVNTIGSSRQKVMFNWPDEHLTLDPLNTPLRVFERLRDEMISRECGKSLGWK